MPRYKYTGDRPVSLPAYGIDCETGEFIEVSEETEKLMGKIANPDFERVKESKDKEGESGKPETGNPDSGKTAGRRGTKKSLEEGSQ